MCTIYSYPRIQKNKYAIRVVEGTMKMHVHLVYHMRKVVHYLVYISKTISNSKEIVKDKVLKVYLVAQQNKQIYFLLKLRMVYLV